MPILRSSMSVLEKAFRTELREERERSELKAAHRKYHPRG